MKWVEIITLRSPTNINKKFVDELVKEVSESASPTDIPNQLIEIKIYQHSVVETDLSIHIHWKSEPGNQNKSSLGLRFSSALRNLGLLNHSVWVETAAMDFLPAHGNAKPQDIRSSDAKNHTIQRGPEIAQKVRS